MSIKKVFASIVFVSASVFAVPSYAGICGIGKVIEVREGYNGDDDLLVRLEPSGYNAMSAIHTGTLVHSRFLRFKAASLTPDRLQSIRALAYLALVSGKSVYAYTRSNDNASPEGGCGDSDELSVFNEGVEPRVPSQL